LQENPGLDTCLEPLRLQEGWTFEMEGMQRSGAGRCLQGATQGTGVELHFELEDSPQIETEG
jgi:hypothetical protein